MLVVEFRGGASAVSLERAALRAAEGADGWPLGFVARFSGAALAGDDLALSRMALARPAGHPLLRPGALVADDETADVLIQHARTMALAGVWRRVFLTLPPAIAWVQAVARGSIEA